MATTTIQIQVSTTIDGVSITVPAAIGTITHAGTGHVEGTLTTSDTAAVIPQGGLTPKHAYFRNMSAVAGEYIDILNDTAVLTRIDPGMIAAFDIAQVGTPSSNLKCKAATGKTPKLQYFIVAA